jgi:hypothetical protein
METGLCTVNYWEPIIDITVTVIIIIITTHTPTTTLIAASIFYTTAFPPSKCRSNMLKYIIRMDGARMAKKVFVSKPEGRRDIGRLKLRWLDDAEDDIKALGMR